MIDFSIECLKNQNQANYLPIRLLSQSQTKVKIKTKPITYQLVNSAKLKPQ